MSVFVRRFTFDPGTEVFLEIEAVNIIEREPIGAISGVGTGTAGLVGEFEDGPFGTPTEVASSTDLQTNFGGFGYVYDGVVANNPSARSRKADGAIVPEFWNGNAMIALNGKRFSRLVVTRVDTSVGEIQFSRRAYLLGGLLFSYALATGQTVVFDVGAGSFTATFTGVAAQLVSGVGVYPTLFVGGETLTIIRDDQPAVTVIFQAADQTQAQVISRINAALGYAAAVDAGGGVTNLNGLIGGTAGYIEIVSASASVLAATGFAVGSASGTGNVSNIAAVRPDEVDARVNAASAGAVRVSLLPGSNQLRMENVSTPLTGVLRITGGTATAALGFQATQAAAYQDAPTGVAILAASAAVLAAINIVATTSRPVIVSGVGVYPSGFVGGETLTLQVDGRPQVVVTFQATDQTQQEVLDRINAAMGYECAVIQAGARTSFAGPGTRATAIPAGTPVENAAHTAWVTMQTQQVAADDPGPYLLKVRPALDDGTALGSAVLTATTMLRLLPAAWSATNPLALTAALTEAQLDVAYLTAIDATRNPSTVAAVLNLTWSARQSNQVRARLRQNALDASASGLLGRMAAIRPPLGTTTRAMAKSNAAQPGVGAYRSQRVVYNYPGVQSFVPAIAQRGLAGGAGFTADGIVDMGSDGFLVSVCSQLPPEENPGQLTTFTGGAIGLEAGNPDVQSMDINDYKAFRASGICAPRMDGGTMVFQSGVTSVDPSVQPGLRNIARQRMDDFITDSEARSLKNFGKKLSTRSRRAQIVGLMRGFLKGLQDAQRIEDFSLDLKSGNTPETLALGIFRVKQLVRTVPSLDAIVIDSTIGETVDVASVST